METAFLLDPLSPIIQTDRARVAICARRYDLAAARLQKIVAMNRSFDRASAFLVQVRMWSGDCSKAVEEEIAASKFRGGHLFPTTIAEIYSESRTPWLAEPYLAVGRREVAQGKFNGIDLAPRLAAAGHVDEALALIEQTIATHSAPGVIGMETYPTFDWLRDNPRFEAILSRRGAMEPAVVRQDAARRRSKRLNCPAFPSLP